jgi:hypothetical protein
MSVRAMRLRGMMAVHFKRVVFNNGEVDTFDGAFSALSSDQRKRYDAVGELIESSQVTIDWYGKGAKENTSCLECKEECLPAFNFCPNCGHGLRVG